MRPPILCASARQPERKNAHEGITYAGRHFYPNRPVMIDAAIL
jgi:hypothetical protein